ncbi:arginine vasopressin-induced protein 1-like isoform X1 [Cyprinodon tularosa]|uniref:arginine vasopressin-induced protein 1-like isoform X1 n=1 Tax=Cyprinodon tularosa TaxID=77115 RepID=UPI0018E1E283|nr:arginine vasopressin-induced protein 1-like isoform X1 [Cyprinodon tularosa]
MDSISTTPSPSVAVGSSSLWRLTERRNRKSGSGNIFSSVNLQQLQRLFTAAGDQDAQQRAQLVWGHRDEAELAQALIALRSRVHKRELRTNDALGSHWLRSFNQLRIQEDSPSRHSEDDGEELDFKAETPRCSESWGHTLFGVMSGGTGEQLAQTERENTNRNFDRATKSSSGPRRAGESNPERYLHRIRRCETKNR